MYGSVAELRDRGFEHVYVELERYDGPVAGLADVEGVPHYFSRDHDLSTDDHYFVWPADAAAVALEREQWRIFVAWKDRGGQKPHPGQGGVDARYDELQALLEPERAVPDGARRLVAEWSFADDLDERWAPDGADYLVRWREPVGLDRF
ncbi:hypothetical protein BBK82_15310 [Lentzea guizhouensis]|uniref:Uncharacterized protein n=1 Tax=Lentzea guizhouensis TaxID=1586287 RepID=A0A1B2HYH4_9PSEU|nr:hypothetical protein [Lentzea guizhouensis]ANZ42762.1 hypothetical protein BBK82_15310 [Lentzea guizhouensis]